MKPGSLHGKDKALFEELRTFRLEMAHREKVNAFRIFWDTTLVEVVLNRPRNLGQLTRIKGISKSKSKKY